MSETINSNLVSPSVENHLFRLLKHLTISDYSVDISPGSIKGDNFLGIIADVKVKGKNKSGENTTLRLIVKSAPCNDLFRKNFPIRAAYEREIYLYSKVLPAFIKIQKEHNIASTFKEFANFYNSTMDDFNEALIMDNMKVLGYKLWDRFKPVDYNHALHVMRTYGKLHALSFALKEHNPELFQEFSDNTHEKLFVKETSKDEHVEHMKGQVNNALNALDPVKHKEAYEKLKQFPDHMMDKLFGALEAEPAGQYAVIGHGDCWINNMLFKYENSEDVATLTDVCLLDWQLSRIGSPALDLGYFIFTCTDKDLRDEHYVHLLDEYYNSLCSLLREFGCDPEKLFPFEVLQEHLIKFSVYGLYMSIMVLHFISSDVDEIPDINAMQNEEEALKKFSYVSKNIDMYHSRIRGVVLDFIKYNYDF